MRPPGALIISLDFELHWGVRDHCRPDGSYRTNLLGARQAVPGILDLFEEFEIAATWATVGFLFARSSAELRRFEPAHKPQYHDERLNPYNEAVGDSEQDDPLHFAPALLGQIKRRSRQEIATHTFSHYYCLEPGHDRASFRADLDSALAIAAARGIRLRSIVFPRNQVNSSYKELLVEKGIVAYRGAARGWMHRPSERSGQSLAARAARLGDAYLPLSGANVHSWNAIAEPENICNIPASAFLRPWSPRLAPFDRLRLRRIQAMIEFAARTGGLFHLWWHPHNFGANLERNLAFLRRILGHFSVCRSRFGMRSLNMAEVAELALTEKPTQLPYREHAQASSR